jgi:hypothetical protein
MLSGLTAFVSGRITHRTLYLHLPHRDHRAYSLTALSRAPKISDQDKTPCQHARHLRPITSRLKASNQPPVSTPLVHLQSSISKSPRSHLRLSRFPCGTTESVHTPEQIVLYLKGSICLRSPARSVRVSSHPWLPEPAGLETSLLLNNAFLRVVSWLGLVGLSIVSFSSREAWKDRGGDGQASGRLYSLNTAGHEKMPDPSGTNTQQPDFVLDIRDEMMSARK